MPRIRTWQPTIGRERAERYAVGHPQITDVAEITPLLDSALSANVTRNGLIVDIGCGEGSTLNTIRRRGTLERLLGIDLSRHRVETALANGNAAIVADATRLPLRNHSVALVICRHVIEHVDDDAGLLTEIRRVLAPGGCLYLETPLRLSGAWYPYRNPAGRFVLDPTHVREYASVQQLRVLIAAARLVPTGVNVRPIRFPLTHMLYRLVHKNRRVDTGIGRFLRRPALWIRIPRYQEIQVLAGPGDPAAEES